MLRKSCYKLRVTVLIRAIVRGTRLCPTCAIYSFLLLRHLGGHHPGVEIHLFSLASYQWLGYVPAIIGERELPVKKFWQQVDKTGRIGATT